MNAIIDAAIRYSRTVLSLFAVIIVLGIYSWLAIPKESEPDVSFPAMYVSLGLEGIAPADAERLLLQPMEKELATIQGLNKITSTGYLGGGNIVLEFGAGFDADAAIEDVRAAVDVAKVDLPAEADEPTVTEINISEQPIITLAVFGDIPEQALLSLMKRLQDKIEAIPSVLEAPLNGDRQEVVEINIDPDTLQSYGLNMAEVIGLVAGSNRLIAAGTMTNASGSFDLKVPGLFDDVDDIFNLPVKTDGETVVLFSDIAEVRPTFKDPQTFARVNGKTTMTLDVSKRVGENIIETIELIKASVAEEQETWPEGLEINYLSDRSVDVRSMLSDLVNNVIAAVILVMIVIVAALGLRSGLLVGLAIPGSFLIGFSILSGMGFTVNIVVLFALILASGMLVDGAIVVVEYADRRLAQGYDKVAAYSEGAKRMAWPIISSTATTLAAFGPLAFWPDLMGEFMRYLPITMLITLTASLTMALIFIPVLGITLETVIILLAIVFGGLLASSAGTKYQDINQALSLIQGIPIELLPIISVVVVILLIVLSVGAAILFAIASRFFLTVEAVKPRPEPQSIEDVTGPVRLYAGFLDRLLRAPWLALVGLVMLIGTTGFLLANSNNGVELFPEVEPTNATVSIRARGNLSIYEKDALVRKVENEILELQREKGDFNAIYASSKAVADRAGDEAEDTIGAVQVEFTDWFTGRSATEVMKEMRALTEVIPGILVEVSKPDAGPPQGKAVQVEVTAADTDDLEPAVRHIVRGLDAIGGYRDIEDGLPLPGIDWELAVDREQAAIYGIDIAILGYYVRLITSGVKVSTYRPAGADEEIDIVLRFPQQYRSLGQLDQIRVATSKGQVPLSQFLTREAKPKVNLLRRVDEKRALTVKADTVQEFREDGSAKTEDDKVQELTTWLDKNPLPGTAEFKFGGANEEQAAAMSFLMGAFLLALFIMAVILLTQFNNFYFAFLTLFAVVLSTIGVMLGLYLSGRPFGIIMTGVGVIALAGIVVNNNIVLIDTFEQLKQRGLTIRETLVLTGVQRLRPVLLTTITTILGLTPMVYGINIDFSSRVLTLGAPSGQWWQTMAAAISNGLIFATILTLVVTPCLIKLQYDLRGMRYATKDKEGPKGVRAVTSRTIAEQGLVQLAE